MSGRRVCACGQPAVQHGHCDWHNGRCKECDALRANCKHEASHEVPGTTDLRCNRCLALTAVVKPKSNR